MSRMLNLTGAPPADAPFNVSSKVLESGLVLVMVEGDLDMATVPALTRELDALFHSGTVGVLILDLSAVAFMSSAGLQMLMNTRGQAESAAAEFLVVAATRGVLRPLALTGLTSSFTIHETRSDAVREGIAHYSA
jgi:anti-sigma B factor antagonist